MEPRFQRRKEQLLAGCQVPPTLFRGVMSRLESFAQPFVASLPSPESRTALPYLSRRPALRRRAQERRVDRLPLRPRPPGHPAVRRRSGLGP